MSDIKELLELADAVGADLTMFDDRLPDAPDALRSWASFYGYPVQEHDETLDDIQLHGKPMRVHTLKCRRACVHLMHRQTKDGV